MKKYILIGLLCMAGSVSAAPIDNIVQDAEIGKLTIEGSLPGKGEYTIQVLSSEKDSNDLDGVTNENVKDIIKNMKVFKTETEDYSVDVVLGKNAQSGSYIVRINGGEMTEPYEKQLEKFYNVQEIKNVFNSLKGGNKEEINNILKDKENREILGLGVNEVYEAMQESEKLQLAEKIYLKKAKIEKIEDLREIFNANCVYLGISFAKEGESAAKIITEYGKVAGISEYKKYAEFAEMNDLEKNLVGNRLKGAFIDGKEQEFNEAVILSILESAEGSADFKGKLSENKEFFKPGSLDKYFKLSDTYAVDSEIMKKIEKIKSLTELSEAINNAMPKTTTKPNGGGGGGYSGGAGSVTVSVNIEDTQKTKNFNDLENVSWAETAINHLFNKGIIKGKAERLFYPDDMVKREEFVKMLVLAFDLKGEGENPLFNDVSENDWYYPYVNTAYKNGVIKGITENSFGVGTNVTRQDMAVMIYRVIKDSSKIFEDTDKLEFTDKEEIKEYAYDAVSYLKAAGVVSGMEDGSFKPGMGATRAQAACMIYRAMELAGNIKGGE